MRRRMQVRRIVFVASTAGLQGFAYVSAYCAAKHGVVGLMRALAVELARTGVTVNAVCPGYTETPMLEASLDAIVAATGRSRADVREETRRGQPRRTPGYARRSGGRGARTVHAGAAGHDRPGHSSVPEGA